MQSPAPLAVSRVQVSPAGSEPSELQAHSLVDVLRGTSEYYRIALLAERDGFAVTGIQRNDNDYLWQRYKEDRDARHKNATEVDPATVQKIEAIRARWGWHTEQPRYEDNEALLFHKTKSDERYASILETGVSGCYGSSVGLFGKGLYFADTLRKAHAYGTSAKVLLCRVSLGDCAKVERIISSELGVALKWDRLAPPFKHNCQKRFRGDVLYTSWMGQKDGFNEFVVSSDAQVYPMYLITYQSTATTDAVDARRPAPSFVLGGDKATAVDPAAWGNLVEEFGPGGVLPGADPAPPVTPSP